MTIKQDNYHVLNVNGEEVFTGTYQECLRYDIDSDDICLQVLPANDEESVEIYGLGEPDYDINFED